MSDRLYKYSAVDRNGARLAGTMSGSGPAAIEETLKSRGLMPVRVSLARASLLESVGRVTPGDIAALTRELSVLVRARIPIAHGLQSIAAHERKPALRSLVQSVARAIESGATVTEALERHRQVLGTTYIATMRAAEASGRLAEVTDHLATMLERQIETKREFQRAMMSPMFVIATIAAALGVVLVFVVPRFAVMFESSDVQLPLATRIVQATGLFAERWWWAILIGIGVAGVGGWRWAKTKAGRTRLEQLAIRVPYIKSVVITATAARFSRVLSIALGSGLSVLEAVTLAGHATGRPVFAQECDAVAARMRSGEPLRDALERTSYLPEFGVRLIGAGRDATDVVEASDIVADHYERESSGLARSLSGIIEPMLTVLIALVVLGVALAVLLPMWEMLKINR